MEDVRVSFPGEKQVQVQIQDLLIRTDQPVKDGGGGSAPSPSQLFFASIAACAGYYALIFCQKRKLQTRGMELVMRAEQDDKTKLVGKLVLTLTLPEGFPDKYRTAIIKAMDACYVKKHLVNPPEVELAIG